MENKANDSLRYEKMRTVFLGVITLLLLALLIGAVTFAVTFRQFEKRVTTIVDRLETVSEHLDALEMEKLVSTVNDLTEAVDAAKIDEIVTSLNEVSRQLSEVDWTELTGNINAVAVSTQTSITDVQEALQKLKDLDIESLNKAITDLTAVIEPLANFTKRFGG